MKNLVIQIVNSPDGGGAEFLARVINQKLNDYDFDSCAIYFNNPKNILLKNNEYKLGDYSGYNPINFINLSLFLLKKSRNYKHVILHGHLTHALYLLIPFSFFSKYSLIYTEHNSFNRRRNFKFLRIFEKFVYSRYLKVISISPYVKEQLISWLNLAHNKFNADKFIVIFNGICLP